jgi:hypothetical protein
MPPSGGIFFSRRPPIFKIFRLDIFTKAMSEPESDLVQARCDYLEKPPQPDTMSLRYTGAI